MLFVVEPQDPVMARLQKSVQLNSFQSKVVLVHNAIGNQTGLPITYPINMTTNNYGGIPAK